MSRYRIAAENPAYALTIGYDPPLQTFFAQICDYSLPFEMDHVIFWVGVTPHAIVTVAHLQELLSGYVTLTSGDCAALERDQAEQAPLTGLQQTMLAWLTTATSKE